MSNEKNAKLSLVQSLSFTQALVLAVFFLCAPKAALANYLQLGVFTEADNASHYRQQLSQTLNRKLLIKKTGVAGHQQYVVVTTAFKSKKLASSYQAQLKARGILSLLKKSTQGLSLYRFALEPRKEALKVQTAYQSLYEAVESPQYLMTNDVHLPIAPETINSNPLSLSLREAILLSLRYNPALQSSELDRIIQRFQLRLAENNFELQYALQGSADWNWANVDNVRLPLASNFNLIPRLSKKLSHGGQATIELTDNIDGINNNPKLSLEFSQPLLRGFGREVTERPLRDQEDTELINKLSFIQTTIDRVTEVISAYRTLVQQNNAFDTEVQSLKDAEKTYWVNQRRIDAGELAPTGNIQQAFQISSLKTNLQSQKNALVTAKQNLITAIGLSPKVDIQVPTDISVGKLTVPALQATIDYALKHNTDYLNALINYRKDKRAYQVALNQQLWQLDLKASTSFGSSNGSSVNSSFNGLLNAKNSAQNIGLNLTVPINDLNRKGELINAKVTLEKDRLNLIAKKRQLMTRVINSVNNIKTQVSLYNMNLKQLALAEKSYQLEVKKQEAGIATSLDVTNTQNQLIQTRNNLIAVKIAYLEQMSSLQQLLATTLLRWQIDLRFL